jgi:Protein of unknown function (DUF3352)
MPRRLAPFAIALALGVGAAGCGSGAAGGDEDPAAAVPRGAVLFADVTLRPDGDVRDGALAAAGKILHTSDPAARIRSLVGEALSEGGPRVDYARDVDPWLGDRAGVWLDAPPRGGGEPSGGAVVAVTDEDAALAKIRELSRRSGKPLHEQASGGVKYEVDGDDTAVAAHDGWLVVGSEPAVRSQLQMNDGASLADVDTYRNAVKDLRSDRLASYYIDAKRLFDLALDSDSSAPQAGVLRSLFTAATLQPVAAAVTADGDRVGIEQVSRGTDVNDRPTGLLGAEGTPLVRELPDGWLALGVPRAGTTLRTFFGRFAGVFGGPAAESQLRQEYGIDLERDVFSWMGDAGVFLRGTTASSVDGGLVVQVSDEARAVEAFGKLVGVARTRGGLDPQPVRVPGADAAFDLNLPNATRPVIFARGHGRVVLTFGREAAADAVAPAHPLGDSATYRAAKDALDGAEPSLLVSMPAVVSLVEAAGADDADFQRAKPYLDAFSVIASGASKDGDKLRSRFVAGLR